MSELVDYIKPENFQWCGAVRKSPNGKYICKMDIYGTGPNSWNFTKATIYDARTMAVIKEINHGYGSFPHHFVENHPDGHDYLICPGESYMGQCCVQLDTGKIIEWQTPISEHTLKDDTKKSWHDEGFCWVQFHPDIEKKKLYVYGCYWACHYEVEIYEWDDPMAIPYKLIETIELKDAPKGVFTRSRLNEEFDRLEAPIYDMWLETIKGKDHESSIDVYRAFMEQTWTVAADKIMSGEETIASNIKDTWTAKYMAFCSPSHIKKLMALVEEIQSIED